LDGALFVSNTGAAPAYPTIVATFLRLARSIGLRAATGNGGPRIHDLRHNSEYPIIPSHRPIVA